MWKQRRLVLHTLLFILLISPVYLRILLEVVHISSQVYWLEVNTCRWVFVPRARAVVEADHVARVAADPALEPWLLRLGVRSPAAFRASYFEALDHVVPERLRKFGLDALS